MANQANYWNQRTLELQNSIALHEQALFQNLRQYYNTEAAALDQDIAAYYSKYGTNNIIQYRNLLQSLSDADKQLLYEKIQDFEQKYPQYAHLMPVRESIYKLDRLEGLRTSVAIQQLKMGAYEIAQAEEHFRQMALLSGNLIAEQMGYGSSFYRIDSDMIRLVVGQDWCNNQDFSARIWHNRNALTQTLQTQLVNGMIRGDSYKTISKSVQNKFQSVSQRNIERLVFTEDTFLANEAAMQTYLNDPDYAYYEYVAIGDGKTCDLCASLTGERFKISERRPGTNFPPLHPWCRCFFDIVYEKNSGRFSEKNSGKNRLTFVSYYGKMKSDRNSFQFKTIAGEHSREYDLAATNPNFNTKDERYHNNCQKSVCTYEARRRGYEVTAKPILNLNENIATLDLKKGFPSVFKNPEIITISGFTGQKVRKNIEKKMTEWGDGSRAIVAVHWKNSLEGHVFMAEQINGKTFFVDPQSNENDVQRYFKIIKTSIKENNYTCIIRTDHLELTENIKKCCEEVKQK